MKRVLDYLVDCFKSKSYGFYVSLVSMVLMFILIFVYPSVPEDLYSNKVVVTLIIGVVIFLVLMFTVRFEDGWTNVIFIGLIYLFWGMTYTMNDIAYWDLLPALASEKKERDNLTTMVAVFASVGAFISGGLVPIITPGNMVNMYKIIAIIWAIVFLACQLLVFFWCS